MFSKTSDFLLLERAGILQPFSSLIRAEFYPLPSILLLLWLAAPPIVSAQNSYTNDDVELAFEAVEYGNGQVLELLLDQGVPLESTTYDRRSLLIAAAHHQRPEIARMLVDRGATIDYMARDGYTVLMEACEHGVEDLVRFLVGKGASVNLAENNEHTSLMLAAENGHRDIVEYLLAQGADRTAIAHDDWTAYDHALLGGHDDIAELIGAEYAGVYKDGERPWRINRNTNRVTRNGRVTTITSTPTRSSDNQHPATVIRLGSDGQIYQTRGNRTVRLRGDWPGIMSNLEIVSPVSDALNLSMDVAQSVSYGIIELQNMDEEPVLEIHNGRLGSGLHRFNFDVKQLPRHTYWLYIELDGEAHREKIGSNTDYPWQ